MGASSKFVEVPNLDRGNLDLSGLVLAGASGDVNDSPTVRRFAKESEVSYSSVVYVRQGNGNHVPHYHLRLLVSEGLIRADQRLLSIDDFHHSRTGATNRKRKTCQSSEQNHEGGVAIGQAS
jgi:hypothetical protein